MSIADIIVIVVVSVLAAAALIYLVVRKIKGKSGCDCGGDCSACGMCKNENAHAQGNSCPPCNDKDKP